MSGDPVPFSDLHDFWNIFSQTVLGTPRRVAIVAAIVLVLTGVTTGILARDYHAARRAYAATYFAHAEQDAAVGRAEDAAVHYRAALSLERDNPEYRRRLALTLLSLRRVGEAESRLDDLLVADPIDGEANLLRGRIAASRGEWRDAEAFYQRAIYGRWAAQETERRLAARYELVELFEQMGAIDQARAELLRLQTDLPDVPFLQEDLARRFLRLGDPEQAANVLRRELSDRPNDAWVAADLSEAELASGRLPEARNAARRALGLDPSDRLTRARLTAITDALALDPTARGLSLRERYRRSGLLLARAAAELRACLDRSPSSATPPAPGGGTVPPAAASAPAAGTSTGLFDEGGAAKPRSVPGFSRRQSAAIANALRGGLAAVGVMRPGPAPAPPEAIGSPSASPQDDAKEAATLLASAQQQLDATPPPRDAALDDRITARTALAEQLWRAQTRRCGASAEPIAWVFDRLARESVSSPSP